MAKRRATPPTPPPPPPQPPDPALAEAQDAAMTAAMGAYTLTTRCSTGFTSIRALVEAGKLGELRAPTFQRPPVWSPDRALSYVRSFLDGYALAPLLLAHTENGTLRGRRWVIDGQQRLLALGARIIDRDGERVGSRVYLDLASDSIDLVTEPGHLRVTVADLCAPLLVASIPPMFGLRRGEVPLLQERLFGLSSIASMQLTVATIDRDERDYARIFRAWNITGHPFADGEIDRLTAGLLAGDL